VKITEQDVQRVADLANLALTAEEITRMTRDLDGILGHIDKLNELDATLEMSDVQPMSQVLFEAGETATLRPDVEVPPLSNAEAMANAPVSGGGYFKVPRVIDRG
jgi:aspartyl-tRNA(Asn)/glutamyl-tRNA(Gln) amidotransferase subunit C